MKWQGLYCQHVRTKGTFPICYILPTLGRVCRPFLVPRDITRDDFYQPVFDLTRTNLSFFLPSELHSSCKGQWRVKEGIYTYILCSKPGSECMSNQCEKESTVCCLFEFPDGERSPFPTSLFAPQEPSYPRSPAFERPCVNYPGNIQISS